MNQALYQAAIATFEEISYLFPEERDVEISFKPEDSLGIAVNFSGPFNGKIVLRVEHRLLPAIASNMLGEDAPFAEETLLDVAGEIANVICGNALPSIGGKDAVFDLTAPQLSALMEIPAKPTAATHLTMDEGHADVLLYLN